MHVSDLEMRESKALSLFLKHYFSKCKQKRTCDMSFSANLNLGQLSNLLDQRVHGRVKLAQFGRDDLGPVSIGSAATWYSVCVG